MALIKNIGVYNRRVNFYVFISVSFNSFSTPRSAKRTINAETKKNFNGNKKRDNAKIRTINTE
jgi:hypothetical protein